MPDFLDFLTLTNLQLRRLLHSDLEIVYGWFLNWGWTLSAFFGLAIWLKRTVVHHKGIANLILVLALFCGPLQMFPVGYAWGWVANAFGTYPDPAIDWVSLLNRPFLHGLTLSVGLSAGFLIWRWFIPAVSSLLNGFTKSSDQARAERTDIRTVGQMMPKAKSFNPTYKFKKDQIFLGYGVNGCPNYVPYDTFRTSHVDLIGTTGAGKGIAASVLLAQAARHGEAIFVLDPKNDEWAPHVLQRVAEELDVPFYLVDLRGENEFAQMCNGAAQLEIEEMLIAGFGLADRGGDSDFYRLSDRRAAKSISAILARGQSWLDVIRSDEFQVWRKDAPSFTAKFEELAAVGALFGSGTKPLAEIIQTGGICYFVGSMRNQAVITAQRMLTIRIVQLCEGRNRSVAQRPVCLFLDELKYHISRPTMEALGAARDKGLHIILAHQALDDLRDCPTDLDPQAIVGAIVENCKIKICYRVQNPETAAWIAKMTGKIQVDDETRTVRRNAALAQEIDSTKTVRQSERHYIDENMLLQLPERVAVVLTPTEIAQLVSIQPIQVEKSPLILSGTPPANNYSLTKEFTDPFDPLNWENGRC